MTSISLGLNVLKWVYICVVNVYLFLRVFDAWQYSPFVRPLSTTHRAGRPPGTTVDRPPVHGPSWWDGKMPPVWTHSVPHRGNRTVLEGDMGGQWLHGRGTGTAVEQRVRWSRSEHGPSLSVAVRSNRSVAEFVRRRRCLYKSFLCMRTSSWEAGIYGMDK